jgi:hypothetical protein
MTGNIRGGDVELFKVLDFDYCFEGGGNVGGCYDPATGTYGGEIGANESLGVVGMLPNVDHPADESFGWAHSSASSLLMDCSISFAIFLMIKMNGSGSAPMEDS